MIIIQLWNGYVYRNNNNNNNTKYEAMQISYEEYEVEGGSYVEVFVKRVT